MNSENINAPEKNGCPRNKQKFLEYLGSWLWLVGMYALIIFLFTHFSRKCTIGFSYPFLSSDNLLCILIGITILVAIYILINKHIISKYIPGKELNIIHILLLATLLIVLICLQFSHDSKPVFCILGRLGAEFIINIIELILRPQFILLN